jgi:molybdate transport system permease protein
MMGSVQPILTDFEMIWTLKTPCTGQPDDLSPSVKSAPTLPAPQQVPRLKFRLFPMLLALAAVLAASLIVLPILGLVGRAIQAQAFGALLAPATFSALRLSAVTTLISQAIILLVGTPFAYLLALGRFPLRGLLNTLVELPIVLPPAVAGLALLVTFGRRGWLGGGLALWGIQLPFTLAAVVVAQVFVAMPFYIRAAVTGFRAVPITLIEAAQVDGAVGWPLWWRIMLPLAYRNLIAGALLSWARSLGEFGATLLFAGSLQGRTQTLPLYIYNVLERDINAAMAVGVLLAGVALLTLSVSRWLFSPAERHLAES